jgi:hypothetical protein
MCLMGMRDEISTSIAVEGPPPPTDQARTTRQRICRARRGPMGHQIEKISRRATFSGLLPYQTFASGVDRSVQCQALGRRPDYSITSSARPSTVAGISRPRAFAVLRLMTSSYLVGACTGRSAGFSPLRMRSIYPAARRNCSLRASP